MNRLVLLIPLVNHYFGVFVKRRNIAVADTELCSVVVTSSSIEVDVYLAIANGLDEHVLIKGR